MLLKEKTVKSPETDPELEAIKKKKKAKQRRVMRVLDRIFGFFLATGIVFGCAGLALEYVLVKGPSPALKNTFIMTMQETRRFAFISNIFLSPEEVEEIVNANKGEELEDFDSSLIKIASQQSEDGGNLNPDGSDEYGLVDEDGDGIITLDIKGNGYVGYMIVVLDPSRVICGKPDSYGGVGLTLEEMVNKYDAIGGINAGGFLDYGGSGLGGVPQGITIIDGVCYQEHSHGQSFVGFDSSNILHIGEKDYHEITDLELRDAASFGPILVMNGEIASGKFVNSGLNPRTAIGQRADGAVIMLAIDGRQTHSLGATYGDVAEIMLSYGAVNAINLDGGSSTCMYLDGEYVNKCSAAGGKPRPLPTAFLIRGEG